MINDKTIQAAKRGDKEAARECTEAGVALPCPFCGSDGHYKKYKDGSGHFGCKGADTNNPRCSLLLPNVSFGSLRSEQEALSAWNTRAPLPEEPNEPLTLDELREMDRLTVRKGETTHYYDPADGVTWEDILLKLALIEDAVESRQQVAGKLNGWIPCSERMPDDCKSVLLFAPNEELRVITGWYELANEDFWTLAWKGGSATVTVTHWMPLPAGPEEEE